MQYVQTKSWQHLSEKFWPFPFCKACCSSFGVILPDRSVSTALNIRSTSGDTPGVPINWIHYYIRDIYEMQSFRFFWSCHVIFPTGLWCVSTAITARIAACLLTLCSLGWVSALRWVSALLWLWMKSPSLRIGTLLLRWIASATWILALRIIDKIVMKLISRNLFKYLRRW